MNRAEKAAFSSEFWRFLWSSILIALSACLGNVVDGIIVGNLIGEDGVSAINLSKPVIQLMFTLSLLVETGAGMLVGFALGKKDMVQVRYIYTQSMLGCFLIGLAFSVVGVFFSPEVAGLLCDNEHLFQPTLEYLWPMLLGSPAYMMMWALSTMVGVDGSPRLVSVAIMIDNAVNLLLDVVFIKWMGWGIEGSSTATVVGHLVGIALMCWHFRYRDNHLGLSLKHERPEWVNILSQGAPMALASVCLTLLLYSANSIVLSSLGRTGIFAFAVCMNLLQIYNLFLAGTCRTLQSLGAIQVGKGDSEAFQMVLRKSFGFITVAMLITCIYAWVAPESIVRFFGASEAGMVSEGSYALRIFALSFIPFCYIYTMMIIYKLYGHHKMALFISLALSLTVIPVLWIISRAAPGLLWYSYLFAYIIEMLVIAVLHRAMHLRFVLPKTN